MVFRIPTAPLSPPRFQTPIEIIATCMHIQYNCMILLKWQFPFWSAYIWCIFYTDQGLHETLFVLPVTILVASMHQEQSMHVSTTMHM